MRVIVAQPLTDILHYLQNIAMHFWTRRTLQCTCLARTHGRRLAAARIPINVSSFHTYVHLQQENKLPIHKSELQSPVWQFGMVFRGDLENQSSTRVPNYGKHTGTHTSITNTDGLGEQWVIAFPVFLFSLSPGFERLWQKKMKTPTHWECNARQTGGRSCLRAVRRPRRNRRRRILLTKVVFHSKMCTA